MIFSRQLDHTEVHFRVTDIHLVLTSPENKLEDRTVHRDTVAPKTRFLYSTSRHYQGQHILLSTILDIPIYKRLNHKLNK